MSIFSIEGLVALFTLVLLQAVLGLDNLLYIALESSRAGAHVQNRVRRIGILGAMVLRIVLLYVLLKAIGYFQDSLFTLNTVPLSGDFNLHSLIVIFGGVFILYTATSEILHIIQFHKDDEDSRSPKSTRAVIVSIILMNLIFSFDSILVAIALTDEFVIMVVAILAGALIMLLLADKVAAFLQRNKMFEVLGLFILFIVGIMLLSEGGHLAHLHLFGNEITPMTKTTFYFVIVTLILIDIVQSKYQKNLRRGKRN